jgi:hypothetical protein
MPFVLNSGSAAGLLNLNVASGVVPPAPSYPFPSTGLVGWYDATKTATISLIDPITGNPVASGTNGAYVTNWANSYTGSDKLGDLSCNGSQPYYSAQRFGVNQASGNYHPAVSSNINGNVNLPSSTDWTWFYSCPVNAGQIGTKVLQLTDQQDSEYNLLRQYTGTSLFGNPARGIVYTANERSGFTVGSNNVSFAQCGYSHGDIGDDSNISMQGVFYNGTNYISDGANLNQTFVGLDSNLKTLVGGYDGPWASLIVGNGLGSVIGEFIIYNTQLSATDVKTVLQYLITKWS